MNPEETKEFETQFAALLEARTNGYIVLSTGREFYFRLNGTKVSIKPIKAGTAPQAEVAG